MRVFNEPLSLNIPMLFKYLLLPALLELLNNIILGCGQFPFKVVVIALLISHLAIMALYLL